MKMKKRMLVCVTAAAFMLGGCGSSGNSYNAYKKAYEAMEAAGSIDADITLTLEAEGSSVTADGNMKMNTDGDMYYEMQVNDTKVVQFVTDGVLYQDIDGEKSSYSTSEQPDRKSDTPEDDGKKTDGSGFDLDSFMEEFATMLEAGKIKEMGLLDPIPQSALTSITSEKDSSGVLYTLAVPDSFVETLFNVMIEDQVSDEDYALSFSNLEDFTCTMHANSDSVLDEMHYAGNTDVTIPAALNGGTEETIHMDISMDISFNNPGTAVEVPQPDTTGYEEVQQ